VERFADSWALEQILSDMEARLWLVLRIANFRKNLDGRDAILTNNWKQEC
jgi:hypothetical protein